MSFNDIRTQDIRRKILSNALAKETNYKENEHIIAKILKLYGHAVSFDQVRTHLQWLQEQGLIEIETLSENVWIAKLTQQGKDAADGNSNIHGIADPEII
jgi:hypothetical protein